MFGKIVNLRYFFICFCCLLLISSCTPKQQDENEDKEPYEVEESIEETPEEVTYGPDDWDAYISDIEQQFKTDPDKFEKKSKIHYDDMVSTEYTMLYRDGNLLKLSTYYIMPMGYGETAYEAYILDNQMYVSRHYKIDRELMDEPISIEEYEKKTYWTDGKIVKVVEKSNMILTKNTDWNKLYTGFDTVSFKRIGFDEKLKKQDIYQKEIIIGEVTGTGSFEVVFDSLEVDTATLIYYTDPFGESGRVFVKVDDEFIRDLIFDFTHEQRLVGSALSITWKSVEIPVEEFHSYFIKLYIEGYVVY